MAGCQISKELIKTIAQISSKKVGKETEEIKQLQGEIKSLADDYATLESRTKNCVLKVKCYGKNLKECAEDFQEDGILKDYRNGLSNTDDVMQELKNVDEQHIKINNKVKIINEQADGKAKLHGERRNELKAKATRNASLYLISA